MASSAESMTLRDVRRDLSYVKPRLRGVLHQVGFDLSLVAGTVLVVGAAGGRATVAAVIYAASVSGLLGTSALYHRLSWRPAARRRMQRLDQSMIFILIAGTYTPVLLVALHGWFATTLLCCVWGIAGVGIVAHAVWLDAPERLIGSVYVGLGWLAVLALPGLWTAVGAGGLGLCVAGGLCYTTGAVIYTRRRPDPSPRTFGYHEVFHTLVLLAVSCHYALIAGFVLRV